MTVNQFKVIIVGGGPVGLTAAHALDRAGIDFVLLERQPQIVVNAGSCLALNAFGLRAMEQLGLLQDFKKVSTPFRGGQKRLDHAGRDIGGMVTFEEMDKRLGVSAWLVSRYNLTGTLFHTLSSQAQAKIFPAKKLSGIQTTSTGVVATCSDGSSYTGSIIIGADGAHSATRDLLHTLRNAFDQTPVEEPFLTTFRCLWIRCPTPTCLTPGDSCETHGYGASTQLFTGKDSAVIGLYERLEHPTRERTHYTYADQAAVVDRWGHLPLIPNKSITIRDMYSTRIDAGLVSLEEGLVKVWSCAGRVVLVGDAAHKFTPSTGSGCNNGILDVAALVGELVKVIEAAKKTSDLGPDEHALESAFKTYEAIRRPAVEFECHVAGEKTASSTWQDEQQEYIDKHVLNELAPQQEAVKMIAEALAKAPFFDYFEQRAEDVERHPSILPPASIPIAVH